MAILARELLIVARNGVAITAHGSVVRNPEGGVGENRAQPGRRHISGVTGNTGCRIIRRNVIRHARGVSLGIRIIRLMAAVAVRRRIARRVVPADVAVRASVDHRPNRTRDRRARRQHVRTLQREARCGVVKLSIRPENGVVARRTHGSRKARGNVVRYASTQRRRALPRRLVAPVAIRVRSRKGVIVVDVAVRAGIHLARRRHLVRTRQRPAGAGVVEGRRQERHCVVTVRAIRRRIRRACCRVHRIVGTLPAAPVVRIQVALGVPAVGRLGLQVVIAVDVAVGTGIHLARRRQLVRIGQREARGGVVEGRRQKRDGIVAVRAIRRRKRRACCGVHRIVGPLPAAPVVRIQVALGVPAVGRLDRQRRIIAHMALIATGNLARRCGLVRIRQWETGAGMIKRRIRPRNGVMTLRTQRCREACRDVVGHVATIRRRALPCRLVAPVAICVR